MLKLGGEWLIWRHNPLTASNMGGMWERQIRSPRSIFAALLKQHGESLNDESLRTLLVEIEGIIISRPITCDNVSDVNSIVPVNQMQLLSMKTKIVMPSLGISQKKDVYCQKYWWQVQHVCNEFCTWWKKEAFATLQSHQKWNCPKRNFQAGTLLVRDYLINNKWLMTLITTYPDKKWLLPSVQLQLGKSSGKKRIIFGKTVNKLVLLVENEQYYLLVQDIILMGGVCG